MDDTANNISFQFRLPMNDQYLALTPMYPDILAISHAHMISYQLNDSHLKQVFRNLG